MTSGTVTKKPQEACAAATGITASPRAIASENSTPSAIRYQANGANPERRHEPQERLHDHAARRETPSTKPMRDLDAARSGGQMVPDLEQVVHERRRPSSASPGKRRTPRPPRGRGRSSMPPTIVAPERDTPGTSASIWHSPDAERPRQRRLVGVDHGRRAAAALDDQHHDAAGDEGRSDHAGAVVEDRSSRSRRAARRPRARARKPTSSMQRKPPRLGARGQPQRRRPRIFGAIQPHHGQDRAELDHHREHAARVLEAEQPRRRAAGAPSTKWAGTR